MTRTQQSDHNQRVIEILSNLINQHGRLPDYRSVVVHLNNNAMYSSRGRPWTPKSVFRMLQRAGYSGLHGLMQESSVLNKKRVLFSIL